MFSILFEIERAAGLDHKASSAINELDAETLKILYDAVADKEAFVNSARAAVERVNAARAAAEAESQLDELLTPAAAAPFAPNYPNPANAAYNTIRLLGLVDSVDDRCDGLGVEIYQTSLAVAEGALAVGEAACSVAGCDPTGIGCAIVCGGVEAVKLAVLTAKIPLDSCAVQGEGVDSAEIEAGYENSVSILTDSGSLETDISDLTEELRNHDTNVGAAIAAHDVDLVNQILQHDGDMKTLLVEILHNQQRIIRLLKKPRHRHHY